MSLKFPSGDSRHARAESMLPRAQKRTSMCLKENKDAKYNGHSRGMHLHTMQALCSAPTLVLALAGHSFEDAVSKKLMASSLNDVLYEGHTILMYTIFFTIPAGHFKVDRYIYLSYMFFLELNALAPAVWQPFHVLPEPLFRSVSPTPGQLPPSHQCPQRHPHVAY